ncbi:MAG: DUF4112 domain-containing protein [Myxococcales bacterium]|nr:DUF4112 domain-containing protein [Myxococcales bacterium]
MTNVAAPAVPARPAAAPVVDRDLRIARVLVSVLDRRGLDPLVGFLLPGVGDLITAVLGGYLVTIAVRRKVPPIVIARMLLNLGVDAAVGLVPVVGDLADVAIQANTKNLALLEARTARRSHWHDWLAVAGAAALALGMFGLVIYGIVRLIGAIG